MKFFATIIIGLFSGLLGGSLLLYTQHTPVEPTIGYQNPVVLHNTTVPDALPAPDPGHVMDAVGPTGFSEAASRSIPSVVYINSISRQGTSYSYWDMLFSNTSRKSVSSGSGVIFSHDGYIVTNNHVIESAEKIQVIYQKQAYQATLVGTDPSTDIAVLKIEAENLTPISLGSSKSLLVGEWVIAVGNPFSLSSTVTAGIVSAKGRRIDVVEDKFPIESFIQTDAAINPGNSGGALVNTAGELVGINTAILSRTGSYTGYAFAVPVDIVKKVFHDIVSYGLVQKPFFGGKVEEYDFRNVKKYNLTYPTKKFNGVLLSSINPAGAASRAGLQLGDIITEVGGVKVNSKSVFEEELSRYYPGDTVVIGFMRKGIVGSTAVVLLNREGRGTLIRRKLYDASDIGATLEEVEGGVKVVGIKEGVFQKLNLPNNYTIISINGHRVKSPEEVVDFFSSYKGKVVIYGVTSKGQRYPLSFYLR